MEKGKVSPQRRHDPDARFRVAEAGVDVHGGQADPAEALLIGGREPLVALLRRDQLRPPLRERMRGGGHHGCAVLLGRLDNDPPGLAQRLARLGHRAADACVGFELGAKEFGHHLVRAAPPLAGREDARVGFGQKVAGVGVDEKQLLLHPKSNFRNFPVRGATHDSPPPFSAQCRLSVNLDIEERVEDS